jgi:hypothetical protein
MPRKIPAAPALDLSRIENIHQLGGIRTGTLDWPEPGQRVAFFDTGAGLRFTVALDRGGDILEAKYNQHALAWLTPAGLRAPSHAYHTGAEWLQGWPGGLMTTCGPQYMGGPRVEDGTQTSLHGRFSGQPAEVVLLQNPDPRRGQLEMALGLTIRDVRMFGPKYEIRRRISCRLGEPEIRVEDEVTNFGDARAAHHWLYHCNLGYPLLDERARFIYRGPAQYWTVPPPPGEDILQPIAEPTLNKLKRVPGPLPAHIGAGERGVLVKAAPARDGLCHIGLLNPKLPLALELIYSPKELPRLANWQKYGCDGCYVGGLEPFAGSLLGSRRDVPAAAQRHLAPGESRRYTLRFRIHNTPEALRTLTAHDGPLIATRRK